MRAVPRRLLSLVAGCFLLAALAAPVRAQERQPVSLVPSGDTYVSAASPGHNFGRARHLRVDARPRQRAYVRFNVSKVERRGLARAVLYVYSLNASRGVVRVRGHASGYWHERSVNWAGRVGFGREIARSGHLGRGRWAAIDVTRFLGPAPVLSLSLETRSRRAIVIASRETGSGAPRLVVSSPDRFLPSLLADPGSGEPAGEPPLQVAAVGDVHPRSASPASAATAAEAARADVILGLGDYQYPSGSLGDFNAYFDIDWGPNVPKLYPVLAPQHDQDWRAADPLDYFNGAGRHAYRVPIPLRPLTPYSFDRRAWHFVALPDACFGAGGCDPAGVTAWLDADLAAHPAACTIAYWHQPYFTSPTREHPAYTAVRPWVERLVAHHVDVVLQAHNHVYERFAPQDAALRLDPDGVQAFVVGTGGAGHYHFAGTAPNSVTRQADTYGVLELTLGDGAYSWRFVGVAGQTFTDSGALSCR